MRQRVHQLELNKLALNDRLEAAKKDLDREEYERKLVEKRLQRHEEELEAKETAIEEQLRVERSRLEEERGAVKAQIAKETRQTKVQMGALVALTVGVALAVHLLK